MDSIYSDILNALEIKKSIEIKKIKENEDYEKIIRLVKILLKTIYVENILLLNNEKNTKKNIIILNKAKKHIIKKITKEILNISKNYHLKINGLIKNNEIKKEEIEFALDLIYHNEKTYKEIEKIKKYKSEQYIIDNINALILNINEIKVIISNKLNEIIDINKQNIKPSKLKIIKYIKWLLKNKDNKKQIKNKQNEILKTIHVYNLKRKDVNLKIYCFKELTNIQEIYDELKTLRVEELTEKKCIYIKQQLNIGYNKSLKYIKKVLGAKKKDLTKLRQSCKLHQEKINDIVYNNNNSYIWYITQSSIAKTQNIKETLLVKIILILKLISEIEKNNLNIFDLVEEKRQKTKEKKI